MYILPIFQENVQVLNVNMFYLLEEEEHGKQQELIIMWVSYVHFCICIRKDYNK